MPRKVFDIECERSDRGIYSHVTMLLIVSSATNLKTNLLDLERDATGSYSRSKVRKDGRSRGGIRRSLVRRSDSCLGVHSVSTTVSSVGFVLVCGRRSHRCKT